MNRRYVLTDGTETVDLLDPTPTEGFIAHRGSMSQGEFSPDMEFSGLRLTEYDFKPVMENWKLYLKATDHNMTAMHLQKLQRLLKKARDFHLTEWQKEPVWIEAQTDEEWKKRYSLVYAMASQEVPDVYDAPFEQGSLLEGLQITIVRYPFWTSHPPLALGEQVRTSVMTSRYPESSGLDLSPDGHLWYVTNGGHKNPLTHIYNYDDSAAAFSANLVDEDDFQFFVVSGSTPANNDIIYFGSTDGPFYQVAINHTQQVGYTGDVWLEYWNGSSWVRLNDGSHNGSFPALQFRDYFGAMLIKFGGDTGWAVTTVNSVSAWWLRLRLTNTGGSTMTTPPQQDNTGAFAVRDNYFEFPAELAGDEDLLAQIKFYPLSSAQNKVNWMMMGLKTRGLDNFASQLNLGGEGNPSTAWTVQATDTNVTVTFDADPSSPGGTRCTLDFGTAAVPTSHGVKMSISYNDPLNKDMTGTYRIFARAKQVGGSDGAAKLSVSVHGYEGPRRAMLDTGVTEAIDLGVHSFFPIPLVEGDTDATVLMPIQVNASASSTDVDVHLYDLTLIPIDEWSAVVDGLSGQPQIANAEMVIFDGGTQRKGAVFAANREPRDRQRSYFAWNTSGELPRLPPKRRGRLYFFFASGSGNSTPKFEAGNELSMAVEIRAHARWLSLRGLDGMF